MDLELTNPDSGFWTFFSVKQQCLHFLFVLIKVWRESTNSCSDYSTTMQGRWPSPSPSLPTTGDLGQYVFFLTPGLHLLPTHSWLPAGLISHLPTNKSFFFLSSHKMYKNSDKSSLTCSFLPHDWPDGVDTRSDWLPAQAGVHIWLSCAGLWFRLVYQPCPFLNQSYFSVGK